MENKITVQGTCKYVGDIESFGTKGFRKRTFVLEEKEGQRYPQLLAFVLKNDSVNLVDKVHNGKRLDVTGFVESRQWVDQKTMIPRFFTEITAVYVKAVDEPARAASEDTLGDNIGASSEDDMPF